MLNNCQICGLNCENERIFVKHLRKHSISVKKYALKFNAIICKICNKKFEKYGKISKYKQFDCCSFLCYKKTNEYSIDILKWKYANLKNILKQPFEFYSIEEINEEFKKKLNKNLIDGLISNDIIKDESEFRKYQKEHCTKISALGVQAFKEKLKDENFSNLRSKKIVETRKLKYNKEDLYIRSVYGTTGIIPKDFEEAKKIRGVWFKEKYNNLSLEQKEQRRIKWLQNHFPDIKFNSLEELENKYAEYASERNAKNLKNNRGPGYKNCKRGHFINKTGKSLWYRSSYELQAFQLLNEMKEVIDFDSEVIRIKMENGRHYVPDLWVKTLNGEFIVEVKPLTLINNSINKYKTEQAKKFISGSNFKRYIIITEKELFNDKTICFK